MFPFPCRSRATCARVRGRAAPMHRAFDARLKPQNPCAQSGPFSQIDYGQANHTSLGEIATREWRVKFPHCSAERAATSQAIGPRLEKKRRACLTLWTCARRRRRVGSSRARPFRSRTRRFRPTPRDLASRVERRPDAHVVRCVVASRARCVFRVRERPLPRAPRHAERPPLAASSTDPDEVGASTMTACWTGVDLRPRRSPRATPRAPRRRSSFCVPARASLRRLRAPPPTRGYRRARPPTPQPPRASPRGPLPRPRPRLAVVERRCADLHGSNPRGASPSSPRCSRPIASRNALVAGCSGSETPLATGSAPRTPTPPPPFVLRSIPRV